MKISKEIKSGLVVLVALVMLIWGLNFLKGRNIFLGGNVYYGIYNRLDGLDEGSPIFYKGFKVGTVREIKIHPSGNGEFQVSFSITEPILLTENSVAQIYSLDLMGSKGVQILMAEGNTTLSPGDTLRTSVMGDLVDQVSIEVLPLKEKTERLIVKMDSVLTKIGSVFSENNRKGLELSIENLSATLVNLTRMTENVTRSLEHEGDLGKSFKNIEEFTSSLAQQKENLDMIASNLTTFSTQLNQANLPGLVSSADSTLEAITGLVDKVSKGEGSLGMLLGDATLYQNLEEATANLDRLLADIRHNPGRYLHFSAVNIGRRENTAENVSLSEEKNITFKLKVAQSNEPLDIRNSIVLDNKTVNEEFNGKYYTYTVGHTSSYAEALKIKDKLIPVFPRAEIISLKDGKPIRLKSALRQINISN